MYTDIKIYSQKPKQYVGQQSLFHNYPQDSLQQFLVSLTISSTNHDIQHKLFLYSPRETPDELWFPLYKTVCGIEHCEQIDF